MQIEDIIVPLDGSVAAERVLKAAADLARAAGARIHLVAVVGNDCEAEHAGRYLGRLAAGFEQEVDVVVRTGDPAGEILALAASLSEPLVLLGTHGVGGDARVLLGKTAAAVVAAARVPVMLIETLQADLDRSTDGRVVLLAPEAAEAALWYAVELATLTGPRPRLERLSGSDDRALGQALLGADLAVVATDRAEGIPPELLRALAAGRLRGRALPVVKLGPAALSQAAAKSEGPAARFVLG